MNTAKRWPIDFESLNKGDVIPASQIEEITGKRRNTPAYSLALLSLKSEIERAMDDIGKTVTLSCVGGDLHVLTDAEASTYNHRHLHQHRRGMLRCHYRNMAVDVTKLDDPQKHDHDRRVEVDGKYIQAIAETSKAVRSLAHKRTTPGLPLKS